MLSNSGFRLPERFSHLQAKTHNVPGQYRVPSVLHVSSGSRLEGLRYYTMVREQSLWDYKLAAIGATQNAKTGEWGDVAQRNMIYINFEVDKFHHPRVNTSPSGVFRINKYNFKPDVLARIRFVEMPIGSNDNLEREPLFNDNLPPSLEEVTMIMSMKVLKWDYLEGVELS